MNTQADTPLTVTLTSYEWHALLKSLEEHMCIVNRNQENTFTLYELIASQLAGHPITVSRPKDSVPVTANKPSTEPIYFQPTLWQRLTGYRNDAGELCESPWGEPGD